MKLPAQSPKTPREVDDGLKGVVRKTVGYKISVVHISTADEGKGDHTPTGKDNKEKTDGMLEKTTVRSSAFISRLYILNCIVPRHSFFSTWQRRCRLPTSIISFTKCSSVNELLLRLRQFDVIFSPRTGKSSY